MLSFDGTEEKVAVRFEGEKGQDAIYEIKLPKYLDPENELSIDSSIRLLCVAHPMRKFEKNHGNLQNEKFLQIILKGRRTPSG